MPLLIPVIIVLILLMIVPYIINRITRFVFAQVNKIQHAVPIQQGYIKLQLTMENITHPQMVTTIRTVRLETSKRGKPNVPLHLSSEGSIQRNLDALITKELGLPSLERGMLCSQNRKKESKQQWLKYKERKKPTKMEQKKIQNPESEPQVKQAALLANQIYTRQAQGEETKYIERGAKIEPLLQGRPTLTPPGCTFFCLLNETPNCNQVVKLVCCFKSLLFSYLCFQIFGETEPRKVHTPLTYLSISTSINI